MSDRITRQKLKEDPLLRTTGETVDYVQRHMRLIVGVVVSVAVMVVSVLVFRASAGRGQERAAELVAEARGNLSRGVAEPAAAALNTVLEAHPRTDAAREAQLLLADLRYNQMRYNEAEAHYRKAVDTFGDDPLLGAVARKGLAASLENLARYEEAATIYGQLAEATPSADLRADLRLAQARNLLEAGRTGEAETLYRELSADDRYPAVAQTAKLRLAELTPPPVAASG